MATCPSEVPNPLLSRLHLDVAGLVALTRKILQALRHDAVHCEVISENTSAQPRTYDVLVVVAAS